VTPLKKSQQLLKEQLLGEKELQAVRRGTEPTSKSLLATLMVFRLPLLFSPPAIDVSV
jgi:hypothetical protein